MIKPILKTLTFSLVTVASVALVSASEQGPGAAPSAGSGLVGCEVQSAIDRGWEEQLARVEKRLAEKEAQGLVVPGAIITAPFATFAPYRTDVPPAVAAASRTPRPHTAGESSRD